jgi:hypothetical protein
MAAINFDYITISGCESKDDWTTVDNGSGLEDSSYPPKQGSQCIGWEVAANNSGGIKLANTITPFSLEEYEVGLWFLNPVSDNNGSQDIKDADSALRLRVYSGNNYADFYQRQYHKADGSWKGG